MFTGLVREIGKLTRTSTSGGVLGLEITAPRIAPTVGPGDSVAVNGICLTVTASAGRRFRVEAAAETRRLTTLSSWRRGQKVHLEPALRAGDPLDGHLVQGHVDGIGRVNKIRRSQGSWLVTVSLAPELAQYLTPKGSVAMDGVSLTVDEGPFADRFTVNLIPHTMAETAFGDLVPGRRVNLEMDVLVKAVRSGDLSLLPTRAKSTNRSKQSRAAGPDPRPLLQRLMASGFSRVKESGSKGTS